MKIIAFGAASPLPLAQVLPVFGSTKIFASHSCGGGAFSSTFITSPTMLPSTKPGTTLAMTLSPLAAPFRLAKGINAFLLPSSGTTKCPPFSSCTNFPLIGAFSKIRNTFPPNLPLISPRIVPPRMVPPPPPPPPPSVATFGCTNTRSPLPAPFISFGATKIACDNALGLVTTPPPVSLSTFITPSIGARSMIRNTRPGDVPPGFVGGSTNTAT
mmetsp:Transcript_22577/g.38273  ORF Transcript_22577/g.38273 Transcript_22577/m.38273 type:complete len:214 (+) Transcript_22577:271-912(+)